MARQNVRSGFGAQRGAINPITTVSEVPPSAPHVRDMWVDTFEDKLYRWSGTAWVEIAGIGPIKILTMTEAEYAAIATPDVSTLYFCTAT